MKKVRTGMKGGGREMKCRGDGGRWRKEERTGRKMTNRREEWKEDGIK
jgi:hypothetical protein